MKNIFLMMLMVSSTSLFALTADQIQNDSSLPIIQDSKTGVQTACSKGNGCRFRFKRERCGEEHRKKERCEKKRIIEEIAYGSFYVLGGIEGDKSETNVTNFPTIYPGQFIPFQNISVSHDVELVDGSVFITRPGDYLVHFGASITTGDGPGRIALSLNGLFPLPGSNIDLPNGADLTSVSTIIRVDTIPAVLQVVNFGSDPFTLTPAAGGDVVAFITVEQLRRIRPEIIPVN